MLRKLRPWWTILTRVGPVARLAKQADQLFRYYVLEVLAQEGLFEYLKEPRTYEEILDHFGYVDSRFARDLLTILVKDRENVLVLNGGRYQMNPTRPLPRLEDITGSTNPRVHSFGEMAKGIARFIPARLRNEPVEFPETFEEDGRQLLTKFDRSLGNRTYTAVRDTAFDLLSAQDWRMLRGGRLLDIGSGSGRETAEIWAKFGGDIHITAVDPVASMLELANRRFPETLDEIAPGHPPLTEANRPRFVTASALNLPFPDGTFDAAFHSLVLHWTADPAQAIREIVRVLKPGGLVFGTQATKPRMNPYFDIVIRANEDTYGFFWQEEFERWYADCGIKLEITTPLGTFRGHKPG